MKALIGLAFAALAASGLSLALSRNAPDRPPGIAADRWAAISNTLGVVLIPDSGVSGGQPLPGPAPEPVSRPTHGGPVYAAPPTTLIAPPSAAVLDIIEEGHPVRGYIMVKRGRLWRPLTVVAPSVNN